MPGQASILAAAEATASPSMWGCACQTRHVLTRRALLSRSARVVAGAAVVVVGGATVSGLAGCSPNEVEPDLDEGIAAEESLIAAYTSALRDADPATATVLEHLRGNHVAHREELRRLAELPASEETPTPAPTGGSGVLTAEQAAQLTSAESAAAGAAGARCLRTYGEQSGTHAAIAACETSHTFVLAAAVAVAGGSQ